MNYYRAMNEDFGDDTDTAKDDDWSDVWELGAVSDCCSAGVYLNGICSACKDHCTAVEVEEEEDE